MTNIANSLKTGVYFTLCFQNKEFDVWEKILLHCKKLKLDLFDISIFDTYGSPFNKFWAKFSPKSDIYVTFKKIDYISKFNYDLYESLDQIIKEILRAFDENSIELDNNKIYNVLVYYLIYSIFQNKHSPDVKNLSIKSLAEKIQENQLKINQYGERTEFVSNNDPEQLRFFE